jgi:hypothetical protein
MKICAAVLAVVLFAQQTAGAQGPQASLVSRATLDAALESVAVRRAANLKTIRQVLDDAKEELAVAGLADPGRLSSGLAVLDDRTLDRLAVESEQVVQQQGQGKTGKVLIIVVFTLVILALVASALAPESS